MARIAIILGRLSIGGATAHAIDAAQHLQQRHQVLLITGKPEKGEVLASYLLRDLSPEVQHISIRGFYRTWKPWQHLSAYFKLRKLLRRFQPEIVHTHTPVAGIAGRLAAWSLRVPCIVHTYHGFLFEGYYSGWKSRLVVALEKWLAGKSNLLLVLSAGQKSTLVDRYKVAPSGKVAIVPVGIDLSRFTAEDQLLRNQFRQQYLLYESELAIGIIGRLVPVKNHSYLLLCMKEVALRLPGIRLFIVGDGPMQNELLKECEQLGLSATYFPENPAKATVTFTSWLQNVPEVMAGLDIVVLSSKSEGTPLVLMEAMAAGKAVVSTAVGAVPELVEHGMDAVLVPLNNPQEFAAEIIRLADPIAREYLGRKAREKAITHFGRLQSLTKLEEALATCQGVDGTG